MKKTGKRELLVGVVVLMTFVIWTVLVRVIDVKVIGPMETSVGFADLNKWFHRMTGVHMKLYEITDWLGLVPVFICLFFAMIGMGQLIKRKSLYKVDSDIIILGVYYVVVIACYLIFEVLAINYRPILIDGRLEASYPSSTTLLVLCVMPTLIEQSIRRIENAYMRNIIVVFSIAFSALMVIGRLVSGVHWFSDIVGGILLSTGLFMCYKATVRIKEI